MNGTWQEAIVCPKCGLTGELAANESKQVSIRDGAGNRIHGVTPGAKLHKIYCRNSRCRWFNTNWTVQVNPDGSIPDPEERRGPKKYQPLDPALAAQMKDNFENLEQATRRGIDSTGEVRNR
jgi:hypothetical protein